MFLCAHFQRCLYLTERNQIENATQLFVAIFSKRNFISIREGLFNNQMIAAIIASKKSNSSESYITRRHLWRIILTTNSVVLLDLNLERVTELRDYFLNHFSRDDVTKENQILDDYLYYYIRNSLKTLAQLFQKFEQDDLSLSLISLSWEWNEFNLKAFISSKKSIKLYLFKFIDWRLSRLECALRDYDALIEEEERNSTYMQEKLQRYENNETIKEVKKNLQLVDSIRRFVLILSWCWCKA